MTQTAIAQPTAIATQFKVIAILHPFGREKTEKSYCYGQTLWDVILDLDENIPCDLYVFIGDTLISATLYDRIRPKAGTTVLIKAFPSPRGGGGGFKNILRGVLVVAVLAASIFAGPALAGLLGLPAIFGQAAIGVLGLLAINALVPPSQPQQAQLTNRPTQDRPNSPSAFLDGASNSARLFSPYPVVLGFIRQVPAYAARPFTINMGRFNVLRMLFVWGYGRIEVSDIRIRNTPIENFDFAFVATRENFDSDNDVPIYPSQVDQDDLNILLRKGDGPTRLTRPNSDRLGVDITFPQGLYRLQGSAQVTTGNSAGRRIPWTLKVRIRYRKEGDTAWRNMPNDAYSTIRAANINAGTVTITENYSDPLRHGFEWDVPERNFRWEVEVERISPDQNDSKFVDKVYWSSLKSFIYKSPIDVPFRIAISAVRLQASDRLSGTVRELSGMNKSVVRDWDKTTGNWITRASNNPASLYRHVLQGAANAKPAPNDRLDLASLEEWHEFCQSHGFTYNRIHDFQSDVDSTLRDIAKAGRAVPVDDDLIRVAIDKKQQEATALVTPKNSWDFRFEKAFAEMPHAFRVTFQNEKKGYREDVRFIYFPGYNKANAVTFEELELPGVTDPRQIWKLGRYYLNLALHRNERWSFSQDHEYLTYRKGERIYLGHDVLIQGEAFGRLTGVEKDESENIIALRTDETIEMFEGNDYGIVVRSVDTSEPRSLRVITATGGVNTLVLESPVNADIETGDLFSFGEFGEEILDALVLEIVPRNDFYSRIICVPYKGDVVFDIDTIEPPSFDSSLIDRVSLPDLIILNIETGRSILADGLTATEPGISLTVRAATIGGAFMEAEYRPSEARESWAPAVIRQQTDNTLSLGGVTARDFYDIRVRWNSNLLAPGHWTQRNNIYVTANETEPAALLNFRVAAIGNTALLQWDRPIDPIDIALQGTIRFRWSGNNSPVWSNSIPIGQIVSQSALQASMQLRAGTYFAQVVNREGQLSGIASVSTKQSSVLEYLPLVTVAEQPTFSGTKINMVATGGVLKLDADELIDDVLDWDAIEDFDRLGGIETEGEYFFSNNTVDLAQIRRVRCTSVIDYVLESPENIDDYLDPIDEWEDFDRVSQAAIDIVMLERHTDDDPAGMVTWTPWQRFESAEFEARAFEFKIEVTSISNGYNCLIDDLGVKIETV